MRSLVPAACAAAALLACSGSGSGGSPEPGDDGAMAIDGGAATDAAPLPDAISRPDATATTDASVTDGAPVDSEASDGTWDATLPADAGQDSTVTGSGGADASALDAGEGDAAEEPPPAITCTDCVPTVLALPEVVTGTDPNYPGNDWSAYDTSVSVAVDDTTVYWAELGPDPSCLTASETGCVLPAHARCVIRKAPKGGGLPATFDPVHDSWIPTATFNAGGLLHYVVPPWTPVATGMVDGGDVTSLGGGAPSYPWPACQIAIDATNLYWTDATTIMTVPLVGGTATALGGSAVQQPSAIVVNPSGIYWTDGPSLKKMGKDGNGAVVLASTAPSTELAVDDSHAYWIVNQQVPCDASACPTIMQGSLMTVGLDGGAPTTLASSSPLPGDALSIDDTNVYWAWWGSGGTVLAMPLDGGSATRLRTEPYVHHLTTHSDGTTLYIGDQVGGPIVRVPLDGGRIDSVSDGLSPVAMATDDSRRYWVGGTFDYAPALMSLPRNGTNAWVAVSSDYEAFSPDCSAAGPPPAKSFTVTNTGSADVTWTAATQDVPVNVTPPGSTLAPGASISVSIALAWPPNFPPVLGPTPTIAIQTSVVNLPTRTIGVSIAPAGFVVSLNPSGACDVQAEGSLQADDGSAGRLHARPRALRNRATARRQPALDALLRLRGRRSGRRRRPDDRVVVGQPDVRCGTRRQQRCHHVHADGRRHGKRHDHRRRDGHWRRGPLFADRDPRHGNRILRWRSRTLSDSVPGFADVVASCGAPPRSR